MRTTTAGIACALTLLAIPSAAGAAERVADGSFEASVCDFTTCTSPAWTQSVSGPPPSPAFVRGPICAGSYGAPVHCFEGPSTSGYNHGPHWAPLGSSAGFTAGDDRPPELTTSVSQQVQIPALPATISFSLHIVNAPYATGTFRAVVNGAPVFSATDATPGFAGYERVTVPLDGLAQPGTIDLSFEGVADVEPGDATPGEAYSDSFDLDDVSLDAPDVPGLGPAGPTGQRAAALAKCKKKHSKKARRKCRRKASQLPV
jgi:hypothetical protein